MTQRKTEVYDYRLQKDEFEHVEFLNGEVTCALNDRFSIVVKRQSHSVKMFLKSGSRSLKVPFEVFEGLCNSYISVTCLKHFLEGH